jgi:Cdc6-like AAA superfamily ATPase
MNTESKVGSNGVPITARSRTAAPNHRTPLERSQMKFQIGRVFTPSAPIASESLFAGRKQQLSRLINAASLRGQHAVLYGERGVGKTSLANVLKDFLEPHSGFLVVSTNCEPNTDFRAIWANLFNELVVSDKEVGMGFKPPTHEEQSSLSARLSGNPSPEEIRQILQGLGKPIIVIVDELDQIKNQETTSRLANTIKTLSDHAADATIILVGVADSLDKLIAEHQSIDRALVQIKMPRMSRDELREIIDKGLKELQLSIAPIAARRICNLSHGLPHYTHSLALHAAQAAVDRDSTVLSQQDVVEALNAAIEQAQETTKKKYHEATSSPHGNLYSQVLLACALSETDDLGYFAAANIRQPMTKIMKKRFDIPAFARHLKDFCEPDRGPILERKGSPRRYRYRFVDPLMEPFIVMKGIKGGLIDSKILESDFSGKPIIPAASNETLPLFSQYVSSPQN